jgi:hypothetical protein
VCRPYSVAQVRLEILAPPSTPLPRRPPGPAPRPPTMTITAGCCSRSAHSSPLQAPTPRRTAAALHDADSAASCLSVRQPRRRHGSGAWKQAGVTLSSTSGALSHHKSLLSLIVGEAHLWRRETRPLSASVSSSPQLLLPHPQLVHAPLFNG